MAADRAAAVVRSVERTIAGRVLTLSQSGGDTEGGRNPAIRTARGLDAERDGEVFSTARGALASSDQTLVTMTCLSISPG
jgi:hypothetical protein